MEKDINFKLLEEFFDIKKIIVSAKKEKNKIIVEYGDGSIDYLLDSGFSRRRLVNQFNSVNANLIKNKVSLVNKISDKENNRFNESCRVRKFVNLIIPIGGVCCASLGVVGAAQVANVIMSVPTYLGTCAVICTSGFAYSKISKILIERKGNKILNDIDKLYNYIENLHDYEDEKKTIMDLNVEKSLSKFDKKIDVPKFDNSFSLSTDFQEKIGFLISIKEAIINPDKYSINMNKTGHAKIIPFKPKNSRNNGENN